MRSRHGYGIALWTGLFFAGGVLGAEVSLTAVRETLGQWVQTRQLISRTDAEWGAEKEMLEQTRALFERELASVRAGLGRVSTNSTVADREREVAEGELKRMNAALERAREQVMRLEGELKPLLALLPTPLKSSVQPLVDRLPADPASTKAAVTERMQTLVSLLNEVDKFQNAIAVVNEKQPNAQGEQISVDVIYVGLGVAYFVDATGDLAGVGSPETTGWKWETRPGIGKAVRDVIAMYRSQKPAAFVGLPLEIR
jgi:hypothetical protein